MNQRLRKILPLLLIVALAAFLRFYHLVDLPAGLHGDEAISGLEARRILQQGSIGPYSPLALGQPSGPLYLFTVPLKVFGNTIFALRCLTASIGTLTVLLFYFVLRRPLGAATALTGAALLAVANWHIHFARIAFPLETWPFCVLLATWALCEAAHHVKWYWWAVTGAAVGLGIYSYNAHSLFLAIISICAFSYIFRCKAVPWRTRAVWPAAYVGTLFGAAAGIILYAANPRNGYFQHFRMLSLFQQEEWLSLESPFSKAMLLGQRYVQYWDHLSWHPQLDGADGTGVGAIVPWPMLLLMLIGVAISWRRQRENVLVWLGTMMIVLMPIAAVITTDGLARRTLALLPFLVMFTAIALVSMARWATKQIPKRRRTLAMATVTGLALLTVLQNLEVYFRQFAQSRPNTWVFTEELTDASLWMRQLPASYYVYFYSDRWAHDYPTRLYLSPFTRIENRSHEFGQWSLASEHAKGIPAFVLLGEYQRYIRDLQQMYPGGTVITGKLMNWKEPSAPQGTRNYSFMVYLPEGPLKNPVDSRSISQTWIP
ncbi:MAG TPA: glycosyltransferase family 39 protein [Abditibacteriaceae bacterium]